VFGSAQVGFSVVLADHTGPVATIQRALTPGSTIFQAESLAFFEALRWLDQHGQSYRAGEIYSDSLSVLTSALQAPKTTLTLQECRDTLHKLALPTALFWIPSHVGHHGNERADLLAKEAAQAAQGTFQLIPTTPSRSLVKNLLGSTSRKLWNDEWQVAKTGRSTWNFFPTIGSAAILNKTEISYQLYQLLTGHCKLNSFLHRIKRSLSFNCTLCNSVEDVEHFLFYCTRFSTWSSAKRLSGRHPQPIFSDTSVLSNL
jgi:ribonuclease HI